MQSGTAAARRVVVTLTGTGGEQMTAQARAAGWQAAHWPGLTFEPAGSAGTAQLTQALAEADWLLLTSPQGVKSLSRSLAALGLGPGALAGLGVAAVGEGTARPLMAWGRTPDFVPSRAQAEALAAELPARPGQQALHVTGEDSRESLGLSLERRGVQYTRLTLYRSVAATYSAEAQCDLQAADVVVVASGVVVRGLAEQLGTALTLLAMGRQTAQVARETGFGRVLLATDPSLAGVLATLRNEWSCDWSKK